MQVTETLNEGLKRKLSVVIPKSDLTTRLEARLDDLKSRANIKGFRPGKVPAAHLRKVYGKSAMAEVLQDAINATVADALRESGMQARHPAHALEKLPVGIWGAFCERGDLLRDQDRVEVYRPLQVDPKDARRRRQRVQRGARKGPG